MYQTCMFCHSSLGSNQMIEPFPVGRRLAFDAAKGRLWVVCAFCERWNLSPLEERWEAVEECERLFRGTKLRVSTDNIGLARISEGLELVRIGAPQRPEMAAWRYGDQFGRRRKQHVTWALGAAATFAGVALVGPAIGFAGGAAGLVYAMNLGWIVYRNSWMQTTLQVAGSKQPLVVGRRELNGVALIRDDNPAGWGLYVPIERPFGNRVGVQSAPIADHPRMHWAWPSSYAVFVGDDALRVAGRLLPKINLSGARSADVQRAVKYLEDTQDPQTAFSRETVRAGGLAPLDGEPLANFPSPIRLALEMMLHEDVERRALEGELGILEAAWKDAEEVAAISDGLL